jgi:hypothetical protein
MTIDLLEFIALVITGFTSCAEFGSYAFVHPVIRHAVASGSGYSELCSLGGGARLSGKE